MAKTMVIKTTGNPIPRPEHARRYIEGVAEVDVSTHDYLTYWTRRISHGEAVELTGKDAEKARADIKAAADKEAAAEKAAAEKAAADAKGAAEKATKDAAAEKASTTEGK